MDDLIGAYFNVYGCEVVQENFQHLGEKRYVIKESIDEKFVPLSPEKEKKVEQAVTDKFIPRADVHRAHIKRLKNQPPSAERNERIKQHEKAEKKNINFTNNATDAMIKTLDHEQNPSANKIVKFTREEIEHILDILISQNYANDYNSAKNIFEAMSEELLNAYLNEAKKVVMKVVSPEGKNRTLNTTRATRPAREVTSQEYNDIHRGIERARQNREGGSFTPAAERRASTRNQAQISRDRQGGRNMRARFIIRRLQDVHGIPDSELDPKERSQGIPNRAVELPRMREELDLYDIISEYLVSEGFCESYEEATVIMANMSEEWRESILEEIRFTDQPPTHTGEKRVIPARALPDPQSKEEKEKAERRQKRGRLSFETRE